jgi:hypothetical protein
VTRQVTSTSACSFSFAISPSKTQSFLTRRLDLVGSNPLLSLPLAVSLALDPLLPGNPSDYLGALSPGGPTYEASVPASRLVTSASSFAFATSPFSFSSHVLSPPESVSHYFPFLSFVSSASFPRLIGTIICRNYLPLVCNGINCRLPCY